MLLRLFHNTTIKRGNDQPGSFSLMKGATTNETNHPTAGGFSNESLLLS